MTETAKRQPLPWFALNTSDYIASTMALSTTGHGVMLLFICHYWQHGSLPEGDDAKIALARVSAAEWPGIKRSLTRPTNSAATFLWTDDWKCPALDAARAMSDGWYRRRIARFRSLDERRPDPLEWREIRSRIFERDDYTCSYCGTRGGDLECDHKIPICQGGSNDDDNLTTACFPCNREKGPRTVEQWRVA